jgi:hypothetical protein
VSDDSAWATYFFQLTVWLGLLTLIVVLIIANRRSRLRTGDATPRWNNNAVGAFALSFFWVVIPAIFAIVALVQIARTGQHGRGLAIAALGLQVLLVAGFAAFFFGFSRAR